MRWIVVSISVGVNRRPGHCDEAVRVLDRVGAVTHAVLNGLCSSSFSHVHPDRDNDKKGCNCPNC